MLSEPPESSEPPPLSEEPPPEDELPPSSWDEPPDELPLPKDELPLSSSCDEPLPDELSLLEDDPLELLSGLSLPDEPPELLSE